MRKLIFQINVSLDGFADHTVGLVDDELHAWFARALDEVDTEIFGRVCYELMADYWPRVRDDPDATESVIRFGDKFNAMPKIVLSRTLERADWNNTRLVRDNAVDEVIRLKKESGRFLSLGGILTIREFLTRGLVDEGWLLVHPVIAGSGRRLFDGPLPGRPRLLDTATFASGVVVLHYAFGG